MDIELLNRFKENNEKDINIFQIGKNTFFINRNNELFFKYIGNNQIEQEYKLKELDELYEGDNNFICYDDQLDKYLPLLESIEAAISIVYENDKSLKDKDVKRLLERLIIKPEMKLSNELIQTIQNHLRLCLSFNSYSKKEVIGGLKKIIKSIQLHHQLDGVTGYLDFLKNRFTKR